MLIDRFAGLRNDIPTERFEVGDLAEAVNITIDDSFKIARRDGVTRELSVAAHSLWSHGAMCVYVSNGVLYRLDEQLCPHELVSGLSDAPMSYGWCNDQLFYANGIDQGVIDENGARGWGLPVPPLFAAIDVPGALDPGTYQYTATYLGADGQESGALATQEIEITLGGLHFPTLFAGSDPRVVAIMLYLSTANGAVLYEAALVDRDTHSATITRSEAGVALDTLHLCPPPENVHILAEYFGHMLVGAAEVLYHSETYGPELFDALDYMLLDGPITLLAPTENGVFLGTDKSIGFMGGRATDEFTYTELAHYGARAGSLAYVQARLLGFEGVGESIAAIWMSEKGCCIGLPGGTFYNVTDPRYQDHRSPGRMAGHIHKVNGSTYYIASQ